MFVTGARGQREGQREFRQYQRWNVGRMENTTYTNPSFSYFCFYPLAVCSPACLLPEVPPAEGTGRPRDALPAGDRDVLLLQVSPPHRCDPETIGFRLGANKQGISYACVPSEWAEC